MKEVLTKKFWEDVKKTFEEAQKEDPPKKLEPAPEVSTCDIPPSAAERGDV